MKPKVIKVAVKIERTTEVNVLFDFDVEEDVGKICAQAKEAILKNESSYFFPIDTAYTNTMGIWDLGKIKFTDDVGMPIYKIANSHVFDDDLVPVSAQELLEIAFPEITEEPKEEEEEDEV
jgi:hypothetical protein